jgi:hypothetical protein
MLLRPLHLFVLSLLCVIGNGCSTNDPDFCSLLLVAEVAEFDADVIASEMGLRGEGTQTHYCIYSTDSKEEVFLLSMGVATKNQPYNILQTYIPYMDGENNVELIEGVGNSAAALFSNDNASDRFRMLLANGDKWSVTIRAKSVSDKNATEFTVLMDLANKALSRF